MRISLIVDNGSRESFDARLVKGRRAAPWLDVTQRTKPDPCRIVYSWPYRRWVPPGRNGNRMNKPRLSSTGLAALAARALFASVFGVGVCGCSGEADDAGSECVPNEQTSSGNVFRACSPDGEWGPWMSRQSGPGGPDNIEVVEATPASCQLGEGTYLLYKDFVEGSTICPVLPAELMRIRSDGEVVAAQPPSECLDDLSVDGCNNTIRRVCPGNVQAIIDLNVSTGEGTAYIIVEGTACLYNLRLEEQ